MWKNLKYRNRTKKMTMSFHRICEIIEIFNFKKLSFSILGLFALLLVGVCFIQNQMAKDIYGVDQSVSINSPLFVSASGKTGTIAVPSGIVKADPFVPYKNFDGVVPVSDVPDFDLVPPPEVVGADSTAARVMDTIVSGILYDKFSPSAILNIEGNDYLVKKGDVVNGYTILNIVKDSVTVKLGVNVYKAGIGEILTEGELNYNEVSNLNNKFGGVR